MAFSHVSVLPREALDAWVGNPRGLYIDGTVGGGGHSRLLLESYPEATIIAIDQDPYALENARQALGDFAPRIQFFHGNFRGIQGIMDKAGVTEIDGILLDLGVSSPQLDMSERGFGYQSDAPLDMRMDPSNTITAFRLLNFSTQEEIAEAIRKWSEERWASRIAQFIVRARQEEPIRTTGQLVELIKAAIPASARRTGGHPARRTFQALRIWVNDELGALQDGLQSGVAVLGSQGRFVVIAFHSLEDRIVKHTFRAWKDEGLGAVLTKKPVSPTGDEVEENLRSRSAKLRAFEKF